MTVSGVVDSLSCPECAARITGADPEHLSCAAGHSFPIEGDVPRLLPRDMRRMQATVRTFGYQWTSFDVSNDEEDRRVFEAKTGLRLTDLRGKRVLDAGCGGGRYCRIAGGAAGQVLGIDLSDAVDHARSLTRDLPNVTIVQGNLLQPPIRPETFDVVYSIGVLHHTPDTRRAFRAVAALVKPGGYLAVWLYRKNTPPQEWLNTAFRAVTTRAPIPALLLLARAGAVLGGIPIVRHLNKVANFSAHPRWTTRVCDTFDWYAPPYQSHHTEQELVQWFDDSGFESVRVLYSQPRGTPLYRKLYERNFLIGSGVNVAGRKRAG